MQLGTGSGATSPDPAINLRAVLTRRGRVSVAYYAVRNIFVAPAPEDDRCFMGAPIDERVHCPRRVHNYGIWCRWHGRSTR